MLFPWKCGEPKKKRGSVERFHTFTKTHLNPFIVLGCIVPKLFYMCFSVEHFHTLHISVKSMLIAFLNVKVWKCGTDLVLL